MGDKHMKKSAKSIYFAAPLFSAAELEYNLKIVHILEEYGYKVFLPQRDGYLAAELTGLNEADLVKKIFARDWNEVQKADIFFAILDGRVPDDGTCVELGMAYAIGKPCYGFRTDSRVETMKLTYNPMISGCLNALFVGSNGEQAIAALTEYLDHHEL
ncbi:MAG: hypothetical protein E7182_01605 [Erysipelotrichaceae bacterium]|nr:hypothetical protein [Erysipelotrichaceae bacterium]